MSLLINRSVNSKHVNTKFYNLLAALLEIVHTNEINDYFLPTLMSSLNNFFNGRIVG